MNKPLHKVEIKNAGIVWLIIFNGKLFASTSSMQGALDKVWSHWQPLDINLTIDCRSVIS